ncbi:MAG: efflux RND transporter periplasmic adaptor subunit [Aureliella sp.]
MKKRRWTRLPWLVGLLIVAGFLIYGFLPEPVLVDTARVERGSLLVTIQDDGETQVKEKYIVSAPVQGKLLRIELEAGDEVRRDATELARIEPSDPDLLDARYRAECEARVRVAEASRERAGALLDSARETQESTRHDLERARKLIVSNSIAQAEFDQAEHAYNIATRTLRAAQFAVAVADHELELARIAVAKFDSPGTTDDTETVKIMSPIDGRVLNVLHESAGTVSPGTQLLVLGDLTYLEMKIDVLSEDAVKIPPRAMVVVDRWGGDHPLLGTVRLVEPAAFLKISALGIEEKRVNVIADFDSPLSERPTLGDGFRIDVSIVIDQTPADSLKVPTGALYREGQQWNVFRVIDGRARATPVTTGATNGTETEIVEGLSEGDAIILHPTSEVQSGVRVRSSASSALGTSASLR